MCLHIKYQCVMYIVQGTLFVPIYSVHNALCFTVQCSIMSPDKVRPAICSVLKPDTVISNICSVVHTDTVRSDICLVLNPDTVIFNICVVLIQ